CVPAELSIKALDEGSPSETRESVGHPPHLGLIDSPTWAGRNYPPCPLQLCCPGLRIAFHSGRLLFRVALLRSQFSTPGLRVLQCLGWCRLNGVTESSRDLCGFAAVWDNSETYGRCCLSSAFVSQRLPPGGRRTSPTCTTSMEMTAASHS